MHMYMYIYIYIYIYTYLFIDIYVYVHTYMYIHTHIYIHIYLYMCIHIHTHVYIYIYICIYMYRVNTFKNPQFENNGLNNFAFCICICSGLYKTLFKNFLALFWLQSAFLALLAELGTSGPEG